MAHRLLNSLMQRANALKRGWSSLPIRLPPQTQNIQRSKISSWSFEVGQCLDKGTPRWNSRQQFYCTVSSAQKLYEDENIPMPFGVVAARRWGDPSKKPVLVVHGWKDNAASFDRLIPLLLPSLRDQYYFLAIDLPGHGFSSHFSPGMTYQVPDMLLLIARILRHFNWTQPIAYMGHSLGAIIGFIYASTNPGIFNKLVAIDALTPILFKGPEVLQMIPKAIEDSLNFERKLKTGKPPLYSYEEILQRLMQRSIGGMDEASCKVLLSRGICEAQPGSGLFHFTHDIRVQYLPVMTLASSQVKALAENFQSDLLYILAKDGVHYERPYIRKNLQHWIRSNRDAKPGRVLTFLEINGYHHLHLMSPETVAPHIIKFLGH